jgi:hypothetical protein
MRSTTENRFNDDNYPKSFGSIRIGDYRLKSFFNTGDNLHLVFGELKEFCYGKANRSSVASSFDGYKYVGSGWEWSVFKKDAQTVVKIPSGIFLEVNDPLYLENAAIAYRCITDYYPTEMIPRTVFKRVRNVNQIEQEYIQGRENIEITSSTTDNGLLNGVDILLRCTLRLIKDIDWVPDFNFEETHNGYGIQNVIVERSSGLLKIIDFTHYFDRSRMHPEKTKSFIDDQIQTINGYLNWVKNFR